MNYKMILCLNTAKVKQRMIIKKLFYLRFTVSESHVMYQDDIAHKCLITKISLSVQRWFGGF